MKQKTLHRSVTIAGTGIHTGRGVSLTLKPAPAESGINFVRTDLPNKPLISVRSLDLETPSTERRTTVSAGGVGVETVEHLMSALHAFGIDNLIVEVCGEELPALDGSAQGYCGELRKAGIREYDAEQKVLRVREPVWVEDERAFLGIFPHKALKISYTLSHSVPKPLMGFFELTVDEGTYEKEIAPARTFCFEDEARELLAMGFGKGAHCGNTLVLGKDGPVNAAFRFPDEPVRHKVLDLIGDLYLAGCRVEGHVVAVKSGHRHSVELVRKLKAQL